MIKRKRKKKLFAILDIRLLISHIYRIDVDGTENIAFPDGTKVIVDPNGGKIDDRPHVCFNFCYVYLKKLILVLDRTLLLPSGQKEIHTATYKVFWIIDWYLKIGTLFNDMIFIF